jgi:hypothetical protein
LENFHTIKEREEFKMREVDHILEEYRQGDTQTRMNLYLFYREVRQEFTDIEKIEEGLMKTKGLENDSLQEIE